MPFAVFPEGDLVQGLVQQPERDAHAVPPLGLEPRIHGLKVRCIVIVLERQVAVKGLEPLASRIMSSALYHLSYTAMNGPRTPLAALRDEARTADLPVRSYPRPRAKWAGEELNPWPSGYQPDALTN